MFPRSLFVCVAVCSTVLANVNPAKVAGTRTTSMLHSTLILIYNGAI